MKKNVLIDATGGRSWIGGLYYKKNVVFGMLQNKAFSENYNIVLVTEKENSNIFECFRGKIKLKTIDYKIEREKKIKLLLIGLTNYCSFIFPYWGKSHFSRWGIKEIFWIADFQECHYPQYFSEESIQERARVSKRVVEQRLPLILSSQDSYNDLKTYFGETDNVSVMHFVSFIEDEIRAVTPEYEEEVLAEKELQKEWYFCICNQFWQHKNHVVILKAMKQYFAENPDSSIQFVFTGELKDYRNQEYYQDLMKLFEDETIKKHSILLGFISRKEQIVLIKNARAIIQPSMFEGWGTVLEDAKVMDQTVILSDIPVHQEQKSDKCLLFKPEDPADLCRVIDKVVEKKEPCDIENGIDNMYKQAEQYAQAFVELLCCNT